MIKTEDRPKPLEMDPKALSMIGTMWIATCVVYVSFAAVLVGCTWSVAYYAHSALGLWSLLLVFCLPDFPKMERGSDEEPSGDDDIADDTKRDLRVR